MVGIFIAAAQAQAALSWRFAPAPPRARGRAGTSTDGDAPPARHSLNLPTRRADKFRLSTDDAHEGAS